MMGHLEQFVANGGNAQRAADVVLDATRDIRDRVLAPDPLTVGGKVMPDARGYAIELSMALRALVDGLPHLDNTGARCRIDHDHDACDTCNGMFGAIAVWKEHRHG